MKMVLTTWYFLKRILIKKINVCWTIPRSVICRVKQPFKSSQVRVTRLFESSNPPSQVKYESCDCSSQVKSSQKSFESIKKKKKMNTAVCGKWQATVSNQSVVAFQKLFKCYAGHNHPQKKNKNTFNRWGREHMSYAHIFFTYSWFYTIQISTTTYCMECHQKHAYLDCLNSYLIGES